MILLEQDTNGARLRDVVACVGEEAGLCVAAKDLNHMTVATGNE